jgi:hypothetical protein
MTKLLLTFLIFSSFIFTAQNNMTYEQFVQDSLQIRRIKLVRPQFRFDNREAFVEGQAFNITGFDAGVLLKEKLRLTVGYYSMKGSLKAFKKKVDTIEYGRLVKLIYGSVNTELNYYDSRFLSLGMPLEIAFGTNTFQNKNITENVVTSTESGLVAFANFGLSATFKPMRFIGLKGMVGYRKVIFNEIKDFAFDGPFTSIGLNLDLHEIISDIKMYRLKKKYKRGNNISNAVDIITD